MKFPNPFKFVAAVWRWLREGAGIVPERVEKARYARCKTCEFYDPRVKQCEVCGCFVPLKIKLPTEECPYGRWKRWWRWNIFWRR
jgi:hypothetical protein